MSPRRSILIAITLALAWPGAARAYRPFDETDADVAEPHTVELELGPVGLLHTGGATAYIPGFILNYGPIPRLELVLDAHHAFLFGGPDAAAQRRLLDTGLFGKLVVRRGVLQDQPGPSVAVEAGPLLPTVPAAGSLGGALAGIISERWPALAVHVNAETDYTRARTFALIGGAIFEGPDAWTVRPVAELLVAHETGLPTTLSALGGAIWRAAPRLAFDAAVRVAREDDARVLEVRAGLDWAFGI